MLKLRGTRLIEPISPPPNNKTLLDTNYYQLHSKFPKCPSLSEVKDSLAQNTLKEMDQFNIDDVGEYAVKLWTTNQVYSIINKALMEDDEVVLKEYMMFIKALELYIENHPTNECYTVYRGSKSKPEDLMKEFKEGKKYSACRFTCTSLDLETAKTFSPEKTVCVFNIDKGCTNACPIWDLSCFIKEKEILLPPYTVILCKSSWTEGDYHYFSYDVLDNDTSRNILPIATRFEVK